MATTLRIGSQGFDVVVLQVQLNVKNPPNLKLKVDGAFGLNTQAAVISLQRRMGLAPDGTVGPLTHAALANGLTLSTANHSLTLIAQPTPTTCWAAATAMMTRSTVAAVIAKTPTDMILFDGSLYNSSDTDQAVVDGTRYGNIHGLRCYAPMSWSVSALCAALRQSPLMFNMLWKSAEYAQGTESPGHMIVISSVVSDNNPSGKGTYLQILDPWPPRVGNKSWVEYQHWIIDVPTRTYLVFSR